MDTTAQPNLNQIQSPSKFDEVDRVRQRMDGLRKHHNESTDIHNRTQPIINEQIHEETMKYLKNGQANGTKTKSQKPRVPKRQRNSASQATAQATNPAVTSTTNGIPPQPQIQQLPPSSQLPTGQQNLYPQRIQQHPMHMQQPQPQQPQQAQQQHFTQRFIYQQSPQPTMQPQLKHPSQQMYQQQQQPQQSQQQQPPQHQQHQQHQQHHQHQHQHHQHTHISSHMDPQYVAQHYSHHSLQHRHHHHHHQQNHVNHAPFTSLPNDLDLTLQAGLECDVDSLIKHEMSVEGQLDFNHDLIQRILF